MKPSAEVLFHAPTSLRVWKHHDRARGLTDEALDRKVRVYRESPETVAMQIRTEKGYAHVSLTREQVETLENALHFAITRGDA